ncbi:MAG: dihydroorotase [Lachnospiraceae bacterium]|nr:dihydroorotase [Lachnospiraceae bacterium]
MLLIKNGYLMDPKSGKEGFYDILTDFGRIQKIGKELALPEGAELLNAAGCVAAPGLVDVHVHFRDPGFPEKEDILSGAAAAAAGGFTTVIMMANTKPPIDNAETLKYCLKRGKETGIRVLACANVTRKMAGRELTDMEVLKAAGAVGFTDDGIPLMDEGLVREAMQRTRRLGVPISFHEENPKLIKNNGINHGEASSYYGIYGSPREAEISLIRRDLALAEETGACVEIQHISSKEGVELVRKAKEKGLDVHAEATPHHFTLTERALIEYGSYAKMNPPLRTEEDRLAIIRGLRDGTIDCIATDHAPHTAAEKKERTLTAAPSGIIGLETSLSLGITELVEKKYLTLMELLRLMTVNPAEMYHLDAGYLAEGGPADLVVFDPQAVRRAGPYFSRAENTPFTGRKLKGKVVSTICRGKQVYSGEDPILR